MKNAIIIHGMASKEEYYSMEYPSASNSHFIPWLQKSLLVNDIMAVTPEMPQSFAPEYETWKKEFERYDITKETILVGHSCGAGFIVRWLSEHKDARVGKVVLVAPWLDPNREETTNFFDFEIDGGLVERTSGLTIFQSSDDEVSGVKESVALLTDTLQHASLVTFSTHGHFCFGDMKTVEFPELLATLL